MRLVRLAIAGACLLPVLAGCSISNHLARLTVTSIDGGRHPTDDEFPQVHFDLDEVSWSRPGAPAATETGSLEVFACDVNSQWIDGRTYVAALVSLPREGGDGTWLLPIGHAALMGHAEELGVLDRNGRPRSDKGVGWRRVRRPGRRPRRLGRPAARLGGPRRAAGGGLHPDGTWWQAIG